MPSTSLNINTKIQDGGFEGRLEWGGFQSGWGDGEDPVQDMVRWGEPVG